MDEHHRPTRMRHATECVNIFETTFLKSPEIHGGPLSCNVLQNLVFAKSPPAWHASRDPAPFQTACSLPFSCLPVFLLLTVCSTNKWSQSMLAQGDGRRDAHRSFAVDCSSAFQNDGLTVDFVVHQVLDGSHSVLRVEGVRGVLSSPNDNANLAGPLQGNHVARNKNAAPLKLSDWFGINNVRCPLYPF